MARGLIRSLLAAAAAAAIFVPIQAAESPSAAVDRFLALPDPDPTEYKALRHLEARNAHFGTEAAMEVWTEGDANGFRYRIVSEEGSEYIRNRVFRQTLETERAMWASGAPNRATFTRANYVFEDRGPQADGSTSLSVKPKRKDPLLIDGIIFLSPDDGDLVRMEGRLVKSPSFWTRHVQIVRCFRRFNGIRMPISLESTANVLVAGKSTFRMTYEYQSVNGSVGSPQVVPGRNDGPAHERSDARINRGTLIH
jgi:hypothetical protein